MQDRYRRIDEILLRRTAGPYIWVTSGNAHNEPMLSAFHPIATAKAEVEFGGQDNDMS
jgi:hypothetical protein